MYVSRARTPVLYNGVWLEVPTSLLQYPEPSRKTSNGNKTMWDEEDLFGGWEDNYIHYDEID